MEGKILLYGPACTGKSEFIKRIKGIEKEHLEYDDMNNIESYPTMYVCNTKPDDAIMFDMVLKFSGDEVVFEKGFKLDDASMVTEQLKVKNGEA